MSAVRNGYGAFPAYDDELRRAAATEGFRLVPPA